MRDGGEGVARLAGAAFAEFHREPARRAARAYAPAAETDRAVGFASPYSAACAATVPGRTPMNAHRVAAATRSKANNIANSGS